MSIFLFLIVLAVLILSHELGHFIAAKKSGIRVDEFGFGFPPRVAKFQKGETVYSLNLIPFGGFVKIHGEEGQESGDSRSFASKSWVTKSWILAAGVIFNIALAWVLIIVGLSIGAPVSVSSAPQGVEVKNLKVVILQVSKNSPAEKAGLLPGDQLVSFSTSGDFKQFISQSAGRETEIRYQRGEEIKSAILTPRINPPAGEGSIGIAMDEFGLVRLPIHKAIIYGSQTTYHVVINTAVGLFNFITESIRGNTGLSALTGPVGIAGIAGSAAKFGFVYFLNFIAFLSINLAIINILPFPALDGGRLFFLIIEKIKGSPINPRFSATANSIGMISLLLLMLVITYRDIIKLL